MVFFLGSETVPFNKVKLLYKVLLRLMSPILIETNQNLKSRKFRKVTGSNGKAWIPCCLKTSMLSWTCNREVTSMLGLLDFVTIIPGYSNSHEWLKNISLI